MANVAISALQDGALRRCNIYGTGFLAAGDDDMNLMTNSAIVKAWDFLTKAYGIHFAFDTDDITTVAGTTAYALDAQFWKLRRIALLTGSGRYVPLRPLLMGEEVFDSVDGSWELNNPRYYLNIGGNAKTVSFNPTPQNARTVRTHFTIAPPVAGVDTNIDLLDHNDLVILELAIMINGEKRGLDASPFVSRLAEMKAEILSYSTPTDEAGPLGIVDQRSLEDGSGFADW